MEPKTLAEACHLLFRGMPKPDPEKDLQKLKDELTSDSSDVKILKPNIPLESCVGLEEIKKDIFTYLDKATSAELTEPKTNDRILFFGDIGTGKTRLIQAIATELKASIIRPGTYFFLYQWLPDRGINYTKALYQICEENGPVTVLFLQNLDLLCGGDERRRTMNRFIRTLQYFWNLIGQENPNKPPNRLVIFATTTWPDGLDEPMILGFGKRIYIPTLNFQERKLLFETLIQQNLELGHVMNPKEMNWIARMTYGISILEAKYKVKDAIRCQSFEWIKKQKMLEKSFPEGDRVVVPYVRRPLEVNDFVEAFRRVIVLDSKKWSMYEAFQMKFGNGPFMKIHEREGGEDDEEDDDGQEDEVGQEQEEKVEKKKKKNGLMWMAFSWL